MQKWKRRDLALKAHPATLEKRFIRKKEEEEEEEDKFLLERKFGNP